MSVWNALTPQRRIVVAAATVAMFAAILLLARIATTPGMTLLYAGLEADTAGEVVTALEQGGIAHEVRGDSIYVDTRHRDRARMTLAADGLPASSGRGYELLDDLSGFGTTSQMFDAAYWRAKEGELARTIATDPAIRSARVHIAMGTDRPFRRDVTTTASVTLTTAAGALPAERGRALRFLVAAAVPDLHPDDVAIMDDTGTLIGDNDDANAQNADRRTEELRRRVERLLAAHLGPGRAVVEASVDTVHERESRLEQRVDPDSRVAVSSDRTERRSTATNSRGGEVTVASNLPDGDAAPENRNSQSQDTETRERTNFEISQTRREVVSEPGAIRRLTVAALVDGEQVPGPEGTPEWQPRSEAELEDLRDLIAAAVGFDAQRGDVITIKSLQLTAPPAAGTEATASGALDGLRLDLMTLIQLAVLTLVALILGLFVVRPILAARRGSGAPLPPELEGPTGFAPAPASDGLSDGFANALDMPDFAQADLPALQTGGSADAGSDGNDAAERLRHLIEARRGEAVEILRGWMDDGGEKAR